MTEPHALASGFTGDAAAVYDLGRAPYPREVIDALDLPPGGRVLDLAAGTGLLSVALLAAGFDVVAVEPLADMRRRLASKLGDRALDGTAEAIPLADGSVDAVTAGDSYHWFDADRAVAEMHRVLRPGGRVAIVWRWVDDPPGAPDWWRRIGEMLDAMRGDHPGFTGDQGRGAFERHGGFAPLEHRRVGTSHLLDRAGFRAKLASISYVNRLDDAARADFFARVDTLLDAAGVTEVTEPSRSEIFLTRRLG